MFISYFGSKAARCARKTSLLYLMLVVVLVKFIHASASESAQFQRGDFNDADSTPVKTQNAGSRDGHLSPHRGTLVRVFTSETATQNVRSATSAPINDTFSRDDANGTASDRHLSLDISIQALPLPAPLSPARLKGDLDAEEIISVTQMNGFGSFEHFEAFEGSSVLENEVVFLHNSCTTLDDYEGNSKVDKSDDDLIPLTFRTDDSNVLALHQFVRRSETRNRNNNFSRTLAFGEFRYSPAMSSEAKPFDDALTNGCDAWLTFFSQSNASDAVDVKKSILIQRGTAYSEHRALGVFVHSARDGMHLDGRIVLLFWAAECENASASCICRVAEGCPINFNTASGTPSCLANLRNRGNTTKKATFGTRICKGNAPLHPSDKTGQCYWYTLDGNGWDCSSSAASNDNKKSTLGGVRLGSTSQRRYGTLYLAAFTPDVSAQLWVVRVASDVLLPPYNNPKSLPMLSAGEVSGENAETQFQYAVSFKREAWSRDNTGNVTVLERCNVLMVDINGSLLPPTEFEGAFLNTKCQACYFSSVFVHPEDKKWIGVCEDNTGNKSVIWINNKLIVTSRAIRRETTFQKKPHGLKLNRRRVSNVSIRSSSAPQLLNNGIVQIVPVGSLGLLVVWVEKNIGIQSYRHLKGLKGLVRVVSSFYSNESGLSEPTPLTDWKLPAELLQPDVSVGGTTDMQLILTFSDVLEKMSLVAVFDISNRPDPANGKPILTAVASGSIPGIISGSLLNRVYGTGLVRAGRTNKDIWWIGLVKSDKTVTGGIIDLPDFIITNAVALVRLKYKEALCHIWEEQWLPDARTNCTALCVLTQYYTVNTAHQQRHSSKCSVRNGDMRVIPCTGGSCIMSSPAHVRLDSNEKDFSTEAPETIPVVNNELHIDDGKLQQNITNVKNNVDWTFLFDGDIQTLFEWEVEYKDIMLIFNEAQELRYFKVYIQPLVNNIVLDMLDYELRSFITFELRPSTAGTSLLNDSTPRVFSLTHTQLKGLWGVRLKASFANEVSSGANPPTTVSIMDIEMQAVPMEGCWEGGFLEVSERSNTKAREFRGGKSNHIFLSSIKHSQGVSRPFYSSHIRTSPHGQMEKGCVNPQELLSGLQSLDCIGEWTLWGTCTEDCKQRRYFIPKYRPKKGGKPCDSIESKPCIGGMCQQVDVFTSNASGGSLLPASINHLLVHSELSKSSPSLHMDKFYGTSQLNSAAFLLNQRSLKQLGVPCKFVAGRRSECVHCRHLTVNHIIMQASGSADPCPSSYILELCDDACRDTYGTTTSTTTLAPNEEGFRGMLHSDNESRRYEDEIFHLKSMSLVAIYLLLVLLACISASCAVLVCTRERLQTFLVVLGRSLDNQSAKNISRQNTANLMDKENDGRLREVIENKRIKSDSELQLTQRDIASDGDEVPPTPTVRRLTLALLGPKAKENLSSTFSLEDSSELP